MFSVKTRFADVLIGQTLVVPVLAPLCYRDPMILCTASVIFTTVPIATASDSLMSVLSCPPIDVCTAGAFTQQNYALLQLSLVSGL